MPFRRIPLVILLALLVARSAPASAEDQPPEPVPLAARSGPTLHGKLALSLVDAIAMGLENNLDVEIQRHAPLIAEEDRRIAWGAYDPALFSEFGYSAIKDPNAFSLNVAPLTVQRTTDGFGGFQGLVPLLGSSYNLQLDSSRATTNSSIQSLSPELRSSFSLSFTQPLLKGLIWSEPWTQVKTTRIVSDAAHEDFRRAVMDTVRDIEGAYWGLIAAAEQRRVAEKSLETARALLDQTQTQYEVGVVSKVEVTQAEAGVAQRDFALIRDENRYRTAQDLLIDTVLGPGLRAESTLEIEPTDRLEDYVVYDIDVEGAVERAFENRPELIVAKREIERQQIQLSFARNQRLPQLDVQLSYGNRGLAGSENPSLPCRFGATRPECFCAPGVDPPCGPADQVPPPPGFEPMPSSNYGDTFDDFFGDDAADQFIARVLFSIPLPNTAARHQVSRAALELRRARTQKRRLEQSIILEVRETARNLKSAQEGIEAAERARLASEEQLRAERIRLEYGESTPFDVLQREEELVEAEIGKISALNLYRSSATDLDRAQGTILRNRNIAIDAVRALR